MAPGPPAPEHTSRALLLWAWALPTDVPGPGARAPHPDRRWLLDSLRREAARSPAVRPGAASPFETPPPARPPGSGAHVRRQPTPERSVPCWRPSHALGLGCRSESPTAVREWIARCGGRAHYPPHHKGTLPRPALLLLPRSGSPDGAADGATGCLCDRGADPRGAHGRALHPSDKAAATTHRRPDVIAEVDAAWWLASGRDVDLDAARRGVDVGHRGGDGRRVLDDPREVACACEFKVMHAVAGFGLAE